MAGIQLTDEDMKDVKPLGGGIQLSDEDMKDVKPVAPEPSWTDRLISAAKGAPNTIGTMAGNALDAASLGYYRKARNAVADAIAPESSARMQSEEQGFNEAHPFAANAARAVGYLTPGGAPARIAEATGAGLRMAGEAAPGMVARALASRPIAGALGGAVTGGATTAAEDTAQGASLQDTLHDAGNSALMGGIIGGGAGTVAAGLSKVNASRGAQARQFIEQHGQGAKVGMFTPGSGGVFADELAGLPANDKGIGAAAKIGAKNILVDVAKQHAVETSRPYKVMQNMIDNSPEAVRPVDVAPIVAHMQDAVHDLSTASHVRAQLNEQLAILERYRDPNTEAVMLPERQLNGLRRTLMRSARVGMSDAPGEKEAPLRAAAFIAKKMVDEGPYASLNQFYAEGMNKLQTTREQLGLKKKPPADAGVDVRKAKLSLIRQGQNTVTGGGDADIEGLKQARPDLAKHTDLPELQRAKADLSYHMIPQHGGLMPRVAGAALGPAAALGAVAAGHGPIGLAAAGGMMALQNATPIAGRVLYPLTRNFQNTGALERGAAKATNPLTRAAREQEKRRQAAQGER